MENCDGKKCGKGTHIGGGTYVCLHNNLKVKFPGLICEWHPDNDKIKPMNQYSAGSGAKVWWICRKNPCGCHIWNAAIRKRTTYKRGCPFCCNVKLCSHNSLLGIHPELKAEWHPNNDSMNNYSPGSDKKVWWICKKDSSHEWETSICHRTGPRKTGCPFCCNKKINSKNSLLASFPELAIEWDPKNGSIDQFAPHSSYMANWICSKNKKCKCHIWSAVINSRTNSTSKTGCPFCNGSKIYRHDNLAISHPELAVEWDPENGSMKNYTTYSNYVAKWNCKKDPCGCHKWKCIINSRTGVNKTDCPNCRTNSMSAC
jgi:hypothetical protein